MHGLADGVPPQQPTFLQNAPCVAMTWPSTPDIGAAPRGLSDAPGMPHSSRTGSHIKLSRDSYSGADRAPNIINKHSPRLVIV